MKIINLDGRFAGYPRWKYALQFKKGKHHFHWDEEYYKVRDIVESVHGPNATPNPERETNIWANYWIYNENWLIDTKRRRILLKNQADISMIMLKM